MLTFLRKIRKSLVDSESSRRYLLYAVGEVLLVMIGILLALQVNNWNEWRKDRQTEKEVLEDLNANIDKNIKQLSEAITRLESLNRSTNIVLNIMEEKLLYSDSMGVHFFRGSLRGTLTGILSKDAYEAYKNVGFNIIRSDSVKRQIIYVFDDLYLQITRILDYSHSFHSADLQWYSEHFVFVNVNETFDERKHIPTNYSNLLNDKAHYTWYSNILFARKAYYDLLVLCRNESRIAKSKITNEIQKLE